MSSVQQPKWIKLNNLDNDETLNAVCIGNSFGIICYKSFKKFQPQTNKWIDYKLNVKSDAQGDVQLKHPNQCVLDTDNKILYVAGVYKLHAIDLNNMKCESYYYMPDLLYNLGKSICVMSQNKLHFISYTDNFHYVWNPNTHKFHIVTKNHYHHKHVQSLSPQTFVNMPSQNMLVFLGESWSAIKMELLFETYITLYCMTKNKWSRMPISLPIPIAMMEACGAAITRNERYIILFGGLQRGGTVRTHDTIDRLNSIYVLDMIRMRFGKCSIKCPIKHSFKAVIYSNDQREKCIAFGFVRDIWKKQEFLNLYLPRYLIQLIQSFYIYEEVHLFWSYLHWKIDVDTILCNTNFN